MQVLKIVLPIFAIIFLGFLLRKKGTVKDSWLKALNGYVYFVALPAVIFVGFWDINWRLPAIWQMLGVNLLFLLCCAVLFLIILKTLNLPQKTLAAIFLSLFVGNTVYMGFPLAGAAFAKEHYSAVVAIASAFLVFGILFGILVVDFFVIKAKRASSYVKHFLLNPLMLALLAGLLFGLINFQGEFFNLFKKTAGMLGATASPVALFTLGSFLSGKFVFGHFKAALLAALGKLMLLPLLAFLFFKYFFPSSGDFAISVLLAGMPTAVTVFVIAEEYELDESLVANVILISTTLSVFSLSFLLYLFV